MSKILQESNLNNSDRKSFKKTLLIFILIPIVVFITSLFFIYYIDPLSGCYITVEEDIIGGNKNAIFQSLRFLKKSDPEKYISVCKNVDTIIEKYCFYLDPRVRTEEEFKMQGCYIKGTKAIYILPSKNSDDLSIKTRAEEILKYNAFSAKYWNK